MKILLFFLTLVCAAAGLNAADSPGAALLKQGNTAFTAKNYDEAITLFERVFAESRKPDEWYLAQRGIANSLGKKGDFPGALQAIKLCLDGAPNLRQFDEAVGIAANLLSAQDKAVERANALIAYQSTGQGNDPMAAVPYPPLPAREQIMAAIRAEAGDTSASSKLRAFTYLYAGKPKQAIGEFADAFHRASSQTDLVNSGTDLIAMALRLFRGNGAGIEPEIAFVVYGPAGRDGNAGSSDDLKNPFTGMGAPPPVGQGGLAGLTGPQIGALKKIAAAAMLYSTDPRLRGDIRRPALVALQRANDALANWGAADQQKWYYDLAMSLDGVEDLALVGAQAAAKGQNLHLGGSQALWKQVGETLRTRGLPPSKEIERAQKHFETVCKNLEKLTPRKMSLKPLQKPAVF